MSRWEPEFSLLGTSRQAASHWYAVTVGFELSYKQLHVHVCLTLISVSPTPCPTRSVGLWQTFQVRIALLDDHVPKAGPAQTRGPGSSPRHRTGVATQAFRLHGRLKRRQGCRREFAFPIVFLAEARKRAFANRVSIPD